MIGYYTRDWMWPELRRWQREMDQLMGWGEGETAPPCNLYRNADEVVVQVALPGVEPAGIEVQVQGDRLTVRGERPVGDIGQEGVTVQRRERETGRFARSFRLPYEVDGDKVQALYRQGVLSIRLPRTEASRPRRIAIAAA